MSLNNRISESIKENQFLVAQQDMQNVFLDSEEALKQALENLYNGDFQQRWDIAKILPKLGKIAIKPLQEILLDEQENLEIRWFALKILGEFQEVEVILTLVKLLETTEEEELISLASNTFAKQGKPAIKFLTNLLKLPSHKLVAAKALAQIRNQEVVEPLLSIVKDEDIRVRLIAIEALTNFQDAKITDVLIEALNDYSSKVRKEAVMSLGLRAKFDPNLDFTSSLGELLSDISLDVCQQTAIALSRVKTPAATSMLFEALKNYNTPIPLQITIIRCLGWIESQQSLEYLNQALFFLDKTSIIEIITILGRVNQDNLKSQAVEILLNFYYSSHPLVEDNLILKNLAYAWRQLGDYRAKKPLREMQKIKDNMIKTHVNSALNAIL